METPAKNPSNTINHRPGPVRRRRKYPWPASRIDRDLIHRLHLLSLSDDLPITLIIERCLSDYVIRRSDEIDGPEADHHVVGHA